MNSNYPVSGAKLVCDKGTQPAYLNIPENRGTTMGTARVGIATDNKFVNVFDNFGTCSATSVKGPCIKCFTGNWKNVSDTAKYAQDSGGEAVGLLETNSSLRCSRMGTITFLNIGQSLPSFQALLEIGLENLRARVRRAIYLHYGFADEGMDENGKWETMEQKFYNDLAASGLSDIGVQALKDAQKVPLPRDYSSGKLSEAEKTILALESACVNAKTDEQRKETDQKLKAAIEQRKSIIKEQGEKKKNEYNNAALRAERALAEAKGSTDKKVAEMNLRAAIAASEAVINELDHAEAKEKVQALINDKSSTGAISISHKIYTWQLAQKVIIRFRVHENEAFYNQILAEMNQDKDWKQANATPESDPYKLMAWLVLLREPELYGRTSEDGPETSYSYLLTPLQALKRDVRNGEFEHVGVMPGDSKIRSASEETFVEDVKADAYSIPKQHPTGHVGFEWYNWQDYDTVQEIPLDERGYQNDTMSTYVHTGTDIMCSYVDVFATNSGEVVGTRRGIEHNPPKPKLSEGNYVLIQDKENNIHHYAHLSRIAIQTKCFALAGRKIAVTGNSGNGGLHLHYEVQTPGGSWGNSTTDICPYNFYFDYHEKKDEKE